jgi:hypothetical protein
MTVSGLLLMSAAKLVWLPKDAAAVINRQAKTGRF